MVRVIGPICCFKVINSIFNIKSPKINTYEIDTNIIKQIIKYNSITFIINYPLTEYYQNLKYKFIEGAFIKTVNIIEETNFAHGFFQNTQKFSTFYFLKICNNSQTKKVLKEGDYFWFEEENIVALEYFFNLVMLKLVRFNDVDLVSWPGKDIEHLIYDN